MARVVKTEIPRAEINVMQITQAKLRRLKRCAGVVLLNIGFK